MLDNKTIDIVASLIEEAEKEGAEAVRCIFLNFDIKYSQLSKNEAACSENLKKLLELCKNFSAEEKAQCLQAFLVGTKDGKYPCNLVSLGRCFKCGGKIFASCDGNDRHYECLGCGEVWEFKDTAQKTADIFCNIMLRDGIAMDDLKYGEDCGK